MQLHITHVLTALILIVSCGSSIDAQQVIVTYALTKSDGPATIEDGRTIDFPVIMSSSSLRTTQKNSIWVMDSIMIINNGVLETGYNMYPPGLWQYRDKLNNSTITHKLYHGINEFEKGELVVSNESCSDWVVDQSNRKDVLGISCNYASRRCSGHEQSLYYAPDIAIVDGPVYFNNIPGLILEYKSQHEHYLAQSIGAVEMEINEPAVAKIVQKSAASRDTRLVLNGDSPVGEWIDLVKLYLVEHD